MASHPLLPPCHAGFRVPFPGAVLLESPTRWQSGRRTFSLTKKRGTGSATETCKRNARWTYSTRFHRRCTATYTLGMALKISSSSNEHSRRKCLADKVNGFIKFPFCQKGKHVAIQLPLTYIYPSWWCLVAAPLS